MSAIGSQSEPTTMLADGYRIFRSRRSSGPLIGSTLSKLSDTPTRFMHDIEMQMPYQGYLVSNVEDSHTGGSEHTVPDREQEIYSSHFRTEQLVHGVPGGQRKKCKLCREQTPISTGA